MFVGITRVLFINMIFLLKDNIAKNAALFGVAFLGLVINQTRTALFALIMNIFLFMHVTSTSAGKGYSS